MQSVISVLVGAVVTGIFGTFLTQRWQLTNWREQQRQLGYQAELENLKRLADEVTTKSDNRQNAMERLIRSLAPNSPFSMEEALSDYQFQLATWNGTLNSLFVRLRISANYGFAVRFENEVHAAYREAGRAIEAVIRRRRAGVAANWTDLGKPKSELEKSKNSAYAFMRDLTDIIERRRDEIYHGRKIFYRDGDLSEYSLLNLVKLLFTTQIDRFYIVRSP